jgi:hypothetical protein
MKTLTVFAFALAAGTAWAQDPPDEETPLTPQQAVEMLKEIYALMGEAESKLNESAAGQALMTEKDVAERIAELLREMDQSKASQKAILEKIGKLMDRSSKKQKTAIEKINELIRKAQKQMGQGQGQPQEGDGESQKDKAKDGQNQKKKTGEGGSPATQPYNPNRNDPANKFRSNADRFGMWGNLPPRVREAIYHDEKAIEDFPPEFQELLKQYHKVIAEEDK